MYSPRDFFPSSPKVRRESTKNAALNIDHMFTPLTPNKRGNSTSRNLQDRINRTDFKTLNISHVKTHSTQTDFQLMNLEPQKGNFFHTPRYSKTSINTPQYSKTSTNTPRYSMTSTKLPKEIFSS